jgi:hypothetical protein
MDRMWFVALAGALVLAAPTTALQAQQPAVSFRGFIHASAFLQDAEFVLGNGHRTLYVVDADRDPFWFGNDMRSTRLAMDVAPRTVVDDWRAGGTVEIDFHWPQGAPPFGDEQPLPRLRLAFADITNGRTTVRVGQSWSLTLGNIPVSTLHTGFIAGWGAGGVIGWRFPGIYLFQTLSAPGAATTTQLQLAVLRGSWTQTPIEHPGPANFGIPQLQARLNFVGTMPDGSWNAYIVGHFDRKDFDRADIPPPAGVEETLDSWALQAGGRLASGALTLQGNAYVGRAMAHHFGHFIQFGDISGWGAWGQVGFNLAPRWSLWGFVGTEQPNEDDVREGPGNPRGQRPLGGFLVRPAIRFSAGPYTAGLEWFHSQVDYARPAGEQETRAGNQIAFSVLLSF